MQSLSDKNEGNRMSNLLPPVHVPKEQRERIDKLITSGLYPSRYAFVKKAVEEKLEREPA